MLNTDPSLVTFEIDVHWALEGLGYETRTRWSRSCASTPSASRCCTSRAPTRRRTRARSRRRTSRASPTPAARTTYTDWKRIFAAAADVDYYHWEYDMPPDAFASSKVAFEAAELHHVRQGPRRVRAASAARCPATLSLTLGGTASFGSFAPGVARDYTASTTANVISTRRRRDADATRDPGHLTNGAFSLRAAAAGVAARSRPGTRRSPTTR